MKILHILFILAILLMADTASAVSANAYQKEIQKWHQQVEKKLRRDNGWLTLAGRFPLKDGINTFGADEKNDLVLPPELKDIGPAQLGIIHIDKVNKRVTLELAKGIIMLLGKKPVSAVQTLTVTDENPQWVTFKRMAFHIIERHGNYLMRLADNQSKVRKNFPGRIWFDIDPRYRVEATYTAYPPGKIVSIVDVIDEVSDETTPGFVSFMLNGQLQKLDVIGEDNDGLFFVLKDRTAGKTTYPASRFLFVEPKPQLGEKFLLDFNKLYNPPCAFSAFTTCPLAPEQNILKLSLEAGEKYRSMLH